MASHTKPTHMVSDGYNVCSAAYTSTRSLDTVPELSLLTARLPPGAKILDLGCGAGIPVASTLSSQGFAVTGVDISEEQIRRARVNVPDGEFICADMLACDDLSLSLLAEEGEEEEEEEEEEGEEEGGNFDAVVAMFSIFHLPRSQHGAVLEKVARWLKTPGGLLLMTTAVDREEPGAASSGSAAESTGTTDGKSETHNDADDEEHEEGSTEIFYGAEMYWSSWDHAEYRRLLEARGFEVLENKAVVDGEERAFEFADSKVDEDKPGRRPRLLFASRKGLNAVS